MCKCKTMSEKILGDGCDECNPQMALEIDNDNLRDEIAELEAVNEILKDALNQYGDRYYNNEINEVFDNLEKSDG